MCVLAFACTRSESVDDPDSAEDSGPDPGPEPSGGRGGRSGLLPLGGRAGGGRSDAGVAAGTGGSGGSGAGGTAGQAEQDGGGLGEPDSGLDAGTPVCVEDNYRCALAGRERCDGAGWVSDPCPLDQPGCDDGSCVLRGPALVRVGPFYVDATEVTVDHYIEFLEDKAGDTGGQPDACSWNTSFFDGTPIDPVTWPITMVDWCDAWAYCNWAGKHLCGSIEGGPVVSSAVLDQNLSQWFLACGGSGGNTHPNNDPDCNSAGGFESLAPVASHPGCEGWYPGLFDLEGNAAEWVDSCDANARASDICHLLGGSHIDNQSYCTESFDYARDTTAAPFGFRCCSG